MTKKDKRKIVSNDFAPKPRKARQRRYNRLTG